MMPTRHGLVVRSALVAFVIWMATAGARAQSSVVVWFHDWACFQPICPNHELVTIDPDSRTVSSEFLLHPVTEAAYGTPDARYLVWAGRKAGVISIGRLFPPELVVRDNVTGAKVALPMDEGWATDVVGNPAVTEVYFRDRQGLVGLSFAGARRMADVACRTDAGAMPIVSGDGRRMLSCRVEGVEVIDVSTGALAGRLPGPGGFESVVALAHDGASAYAVVDDAGTRLRRYRVSTGEILAERILPALPQNPSLRVEPRTGRLFLLATAGAQSFSPDTLQPLASLAGNWRRHWVFDPARPRAYVVATEGSPFRTTFTTIDTDTLTVLATWELPAAGLARAALAVPRPSPPTGLVGSVLGNTVALTWSAGEGGAPSGRFLVEAGSSPGANDIVPGFDVGLDLGLVAVAVPPGRYYVRIRAGNYAGLSAPSNEVVVQVP